MKQHVTMTMVAVLAFFLQEMNIAIADSSQAMPTDASRETGFTTPSQTFDIAIIFERSPKKHACFWLYSAVWLLQ